MGTKEQVIQEETSEDIKQADKDIDFDKNRRLQHACLMEYSHFQLDFTQVFGKKFYVMIIGKLKISKLSIYFFELLVN